MDLASSRGMRLWNSLGMIEGWAGGYKRPETDERIFRRKRASSVASQAESGAYIFIIQGIRGKRVYRRRGSGVLLCPEAMRGEDRAAWGLLGIRPRRLKWIGAEFRILTGSP